MVSAMRDRGRSFSLALRSLLWAILLPGFFAGYVPWKYFGLHDVRPDWSDPLNVLGMFCTLIGAGLLVACIVEFARRGGGTLSPVDPPRQLVVRGLYRYVRNPMYLSVTMIVLGEALLARSRPLAIYWAIWFLCVNLFVLGYEEPTLRQQFGASYDDYTKKVGRWLPRLPPCCIAAALAFSPVQNRSAPLVDHHQHLFSPAAAALVSTPAAAFRRLPLSDAEFNTIAGNVAPFLR